MGTAVSRVVWKGTVVCEGKVLVWEIVECEMVVRWVNVRWGIWAEPTVACVKFPPLPHIKILSPYLTICPTIIYPTLPNPLL